MKCKNCGGTGYFATNCYADIEECSTCDGTGVVEPMTNEEWIKSCNTEQLAELFYTVWVKGFFEQTLSVPEDMNNLIIEWLKQPHKDGES